MCIGRTDLASRLVLKSSSNKGDSEPTSPILRSRPDLCRRLDLHSFVEGLSLGFRVGFGFAGCFNIKQTPELQRLLSPDSPDADDLLSPVGKRRLESEES